MSDSSRRCQRGPLRARHPRTAQRPTVSAAQGDQVRGDHDIRRRMPNLLVRPLKRRFAIADKLCADRAVATPRDPREPPLKARICGTIMAEATANLTRNTILVTRLAIRLLLYEAQTLARLNLTATRIYVSPAMVGAVHPRHIQDHARQDYKAVG